MGKVFSVVVLALAVAGCATKPPREDQLRVPPPDRLLAFQSPADGDAQIIVTRDAGSVGSGCYQAVFMDGKESARLATSERVTFHVPSGEHIVGAWTTGSGLCGYREGKDRREQATVLKPGETKKFRITIDPSGGGVSISPTTL